ncbi:hypothetical protein TrVE_jg8088 [Triparma verrucosa]|uniref:DDH domain-containing protein n=1 Tax=Triparma verrucosa TaxID=1606542 RepID=A0A9W7CIG7_9STRA|nr:hypothetical protein TrVE_jg8088 [Triparma verrucosa]
MSSPLQCTVPPIPPNPTFILSNPSGDLDSTISSYSLSSLIPNSVPVLNYRSTDVKLKPDSLKALELHPIDKHPLYVDDFFRYCEVESEFNIILVDHNSLSFTSPHSPSLYSKMSSRVIKIIDHHSPSNSHSHADIYLEGVASCCTLIYRKDMENVYKILVAITILVDSNFLSPTSGKTTEKDISVITSIIEDLGPQYQEIIYRHAKEVNDAKFSTEFWKGLTKKEASRIDYKEMKVEGVVVGVASVLVELESYKGGEEEEVEVDCLIIGSCVINGEEVVRELEVVEGKNKEVSEKVREWLDSGGGLLQTRRKEGDDLIWRQENAKGSRKVLMPELEKIFKD